MLVYHREYEEFLLRLRDAGVVHIEQRGSGAMENEELKQLISEHTRYSRIIKSIENLAPDSKDTVSNASGVKEVADRVEQMQANLEQLKQVLAVAEKDAAAMVAWGEFDMTLLEKLHADGYVVNFFMTPLKLYNPAWENIYNAFVVNNISSRVYFVTITGSETPVEIDAEPVRIPSSSLSQLTAEVERLNMEIKLMQEQLASFAMQNLPLLRAAQKELQHNMEFSQVALGGEKLTGDKLLLLQGWVPEEEKTQLVAKLDEEPVFYELSKPQPDDNVPIRFKNNAFFRMFEPICELYMLPKYNELDLTPFFAPFYMVFFGLCLGDMGYGLVISIASAVMLMLMKKGNSMVGYARLALTLGLSTVLCGSLTGTFFGFNLYTWGIPVLDWWRDSFSFAYMNPDTGKLNDPNDMLFNLALILGGVQICYAMGIKIANQIIQLGFKYSVATIGWLMIILTTVAVAFIPSMPMAVAYVLYAMGAAGALFYNSPDKNIFLNIGLGLWDAYNMATGLLGDMLSYIRLFALGLSGGVLATVFNNIAVQMSPDIPVLGAVVTILIFLFGHALNIFMNTLGAFVHPIRLTFVEFFKNAGYEGGGTAYKPFK